MVNLKYRSRGKSVTLLQEMLNTLGYGLSVDGSFGRGTERAVKDFQLKNGLMSDGVVGSKSWSVLSSLAPISLPDISDKKLQEKDIIAFASKFGVEVAAVKAVQKVEAKGKGFLHNGEPIILFEGHKFWEELKKIGLDPRSLKTGHEDILHQKWTKKFYKGGTAEYTRLRKAEKIHTHAAVKSAACAAASWGMFQILGGNYKLAGFDSVEKFVEAMKKSETEHLMAFGNFIKNRRLENIRLLDHLREKNWAKFAKGYNGSAYKVNKYDTRMATAYERFKGQ